MAIMNVFGIIDISNQDRGSMHFLGRFEYRDIEDDINALERFLIDMDDEYANLKLYAFTNREVRAMERDGEARMGGSPFLERAAEVVVTSKKDSDSLANSVLEWVDDARIEESAVRDYLDNWIPGGDGNEKLDGTVVKMYVLLRSDGPYGVVHAYWTVERPMHEANDSTVPVNSVVAGASKGVKMQRLPKFVAKSRANGVLDGNAWFAEDDGIEFVGKTQKEVRFLIDVYRAAKNQK